MAASNSTGRNSFVLGSFESRTRPPRPFTYYFYRIFISTWLPSLSLSLSLLHEDIVFARSVALEGRGRDSWLDACPTIPSILRKDSCYSC